MKNKFAILFAVLAISACTTTKTEYIPKPVFPTPPAILMEEPEEFITIEVDVVEENV